MELKQGVHQWSERWKQFIATPQGREWYYYGKIYGIFIGILVVLMILFDVWIMPYYVGLDKVVNVPGVVGHSINNARKMLEEQGLSVRIRNEYFNNTIPAGYVTNQIPYPNTQVKPDRTIYLDISKGKQLIEIPDLVGLTLRDAKLALLRTNGLQMNRISYSYNNNLPPDIIASQSVRKGTKVPYGTQVDVVVSLGAEDVYVAVPEFVGKAVEEAKVLIVKHGLSIGTIITGERDETRLPGTVLNQIPPARDSVKTGTPVHLTISK